MGGGTMARFLLVAQSGYARHGVPGIPSREAQGIVASPGGQPINDIPGSAHVNVLDADGRREDLR